MNVFLFTRTNKTIGLSDFQTCEHKMIFVVKYLICMLDFAVIPY